jgi:hypothetical protein
LADEVVAVLAAGVEVAILAVGGGVCWTTGFVFEFSVRIAVFARTSSFSGVGHGCRFEADV